MRRIAIRRIVGTAFAVCCIVLSVQAGIGAYRIYADVIESLNTRPMETAIDFSQAGETIVPFHQTFDRAHGELLLFECELDNDARPNVDELFKGLSGTVTITDKDGNQTESVTINDQSPLGRGDAYLLHRLARFPRGEYTATIKIDSEAPALAGKKQTIYARYHMCGLDMFPVYGISVFAFFLGVMGLTAMGCVLPNLVRSGIWFEVKHEVDRFEKTLKQPQKRTS